MRFAVVLLLAVHGLIHLLGFLKAWQLADVPQLTGATLFTLPEPLPRVAGALWLVACLALVGAAPMLVMRLGGWWIVAAVGIAISQLLVVYAWPDAKAGTVLNVVLLVVILIAW